MTSHFLNVMFTPAVKEAQERNRSRDAYARRDGATDPDRLTEAEAAFIASRDSFYMATVSETGWPYLQHRGGPRGFVKVLGERAIGLADFRGNRQYVSVGNLSRDDRVALFFMDYPQRQRLKLLGHMHVVDFANAPELASILVDGAYGARVERGLVVEIEAFDWNCSQHITPRYTADEIVPVIEALTAAPVTG
jgi:predicted pyridoxine 5'-phosphate oxidase superfamily flavin-nucleotide-binding protein